MRLLIIAKTGYFTFLVKKSYSIEKANEAFWCILSCVGLARRYILAGEKLKCGRKRRHNVQQTQHWLKLRQHKKRKARKWLL